MTEQSTPNSEHPLEFLPELALGVLTEQEAAPVREHLAGCASCQGEYAIMSEAARMLPFAAEEVDPAPELRGGLMERIASEPRVLRQRPAAKPRPAWQSLGSIAAAAAVLVAVGAFAGALVWGGGDGDLQAEVDRQGQLVQAVAQGRARRDTAQDGATTATVVYVPGQTSAFAWLEGLPELPAGKAYQAWFIADGAPRPSTVFSERGEGVWLESSSDVAASTAMAFTIEDQDGAEAPSQTPFIVIELNGASAANPFALPAWLTRAAHD